MQVRHGYPVVPVRPLDPAIAEEWGRETIVPIAAAVHGVGAARLGGADRWGWHVQVAAMEHVRGGALEAELRREIAAALAAVPGVVEVAEEDREVWAVDGAPAGDALVAAVAAVVDARERAITAIVERDDDDGDGGDDGGGDAGDGGDAAFDGDER